METLDSWWDGLSPVLKFFYAIGILASTVLAVQTLLTLIGLDGGDADVDAPGDLALDGLDAPDLPEDLDVAADAPDFDPERAEVLGAADGNDKSGLGLLSVRSVTGFLLGFGWTGAWVIQSGHSLWLALPLAALAGTAFLFAVYFLMRLLWSLRESGTLDFRNAVGEIGTVYLPIPGERGGKGQIEVMIQGRLKVVQAETSRPDRIGNREQVLVIDVLEDNSLLVIPEE